MKVEIEIPDIHLATIRDWYKRPLDDYHIALFAEVAVLRRLNGIWNGEEK